MRAMTSQDFFAAFRGRKSVGPSNRSTKAREAVLKNYRPPPMAAPRRGAVQRTLEQAFSRSTTVTAACDMET